MDTVAQVIVQGKEEKQALNEAVGKILDLEKCFNCFSPESEISKLCSDIKVGEPYIISDDLFEVLALAKKIHRDSEGLFDVDFLNKDRAKDYVLIAPNTIIFNSKKTRFNLGAIGKGFAADKAMEVIKRLNTEKAMISMGGQITCFSKTEPWRLGLQNPEKEYGQMLGVLEVANGTLSTSAENYRGHHIKTPKGQKRKVSVESVSVFSDSATIADAFSTALFLSDKRTMKNTIKVSNLDVIIIDGKKVMVLGNVVESLKLTDKTYQIKKLNLKG